MSNRIKFQKQLKDLVVLINIIHKYSINVQNNSNAINKAQTDFFSNYAKLNNTKNS